LFRFKSAAVAGTVGTSPSWARAREWPLLPKNIFFFSILLFLVLHILGVHLSPSLPFFFNYIFPVSSV
jgi:hypothetical protein